MSSAAGAAAGGAAAAEASSASGIHRKLEGDLMSIWVVNQDKDKLFLAIGFRARGSRLQAQSMLAGSWETVGKFADDQSCQRVLRDITAKVADKDARRVEIPTG